MAKISRQAELTLFDSKRLAPRPPKPPCLSNEHITGLARTILTGTLLAC
jgi:hypothetical protein